MITKKNGDNAVFSLSKKWPCHFSAKLMRWLRCGHLKFRYPEGETALPFPPFP